MKKTALIVLVLFTLVVVAPVAMAQEKPAKAKAETTVAPAKAKAETAVAPAKEPPKAKATEKVKTEKVKTEKAKTEKVKTEKGKAPAKGKAEKGGTKAEESTKTPTTK